MNHFSLAVVAYCQFFASNSVIIQCNLGNSIHRHMKFHFITTKWPITINKFNQSKHTLSNNLAVCSISLMGHDDQLIEQYDNYCLIRCVYTVGFNCQIFIGHSCKYFYLPLFQGPASLVRCIQTRIHTGSRHWLYASRQWNWLLKLWQIEIILFQQPSK